MGKFEKGNTIGKGRPKGSQNRATTKLKDKVQELLDGNFDTVQDDLDQCEPHIRLKLMIDLMAYVMPKQKAIEATVTAISDMTPGKVERLERMSELMIEIEAEKEQARLDAKRL